MDRHPEVCRFGTTVMSLRAKWLLISVGGGLLTSVGLVLLTNHPSVIFLLPAPGTILRPLLWPVTAMVYLAGPGSNIGPPERHMHEWTPVHDIAVAMGLALRGAFIPAFCSLSFGPGSD